MENNHKPGNTENREQRKPLDFLSTVVESTINKRVFSIELIDHLSDHKWNLQIGLTTNEDLLTATAARKKMKKLAKELRNKFCACTRFIVFFLPERTDGGVTNSFYVFIKVKNENTMKHLKQLMKIWNKINPLPLNKKRKDLICFPPNLSSIWWIKSAAKKLSTDDIIIYAPSECH